MRVLFMGASDLGWHCCRAASQAGLELVGIFSIPREFRISWSAAPVRNVVFHDFSDLAEQLSVPLTWITGRLNQPQYVDQVRRLKPDLLLAVGWYYLVPSRIRALVPLGATGIHASLLPKYRGGAPLVWAVLRGERETGVSLFYLDDGVDTGDIIAQRRFPIQATDDISTLVDRARDAAVSLILEYGPQLAARTAPRIPQDHAAATVVPQRTPEDGWIDWGALSASEAYNWVRAQTRPYPGAYTAAGSRLMRVWRAHVGHTDLRDGRLAAGTIGAPVGGSVPVTCADGGVLLLDEVELEGEGDCGPAAEVIARAGLSPSTTLGRR
jgi:methionyl-tRNA formyltransferase